MHDFTTAFTIGKPTIGSFKGIDTNTSNKSPLFSKCLSPVRDMDIMSIYNYVLSVLNLSMSPMIRQDFINQC